MITCCKHILLKKKKKIVIEKKKQVIEGFVSDITHVSPLFILIKQKTNLQQVIQLYKKEISVLARRVLFPRMSEQAN